MSSFEGGILPAVRFEDVEPIYLTRYGSHAYGLATASSDLDLRGVFVPPRRYYLGFRRRLEQVQRQDVEADVVLFELTKFFRLAADSNPSVLEILFTHRDDVLEIDPLGERLRTLGPRFLSRKIRHTFGGYARSQLRRIRNHYRWLQDPPDHPPTREEFGLPAERPISGAQLQAAESMIDKKMAGWAVDYGPVEAAVKIDVEARIARYLAEVATAVGFGGEADGGPEHLRFMAAAGSLGFDDNFLELLNREKRYRRESRNWQQYREWQRNRNPARAELERRFGYDTKHAMHLVRMLRMARETLASGEVRVRRGDREELLAIRERGIWSYEELVAWAEERDAELDAVAAASPLPVQPDFESLDAACVEMVAEALG